MSSEVGVEASGREGDQRFPWQMSLAPNTLDDPFSLTQNVLDQYPPLFWSPAANPAVEGPGMWVATRYEVIREVFQNTDHYSSDGVYPYFRMMGEDLRAIPISIDPPEHGKYRKLLEPWFSPKAVVALEPRIRAIVDKLIDGFVDKGECDVAYDFGRVYPVKVFMALMGFPEDMFEQFLAWSHPMHFDTQNPAAMIGAAQGALNYMREFIAELHASPPNDGLASFIVRAEVEGRPLTDDEILGIIFFLWDGGMDTVAATSSLVFRRLAVDQGLQQIFRDNVGKMPVAIEEFLRMHPTVNTVRVAKVDHELEGQQVRKGDWVMCLAAAGNFDPEKFDDPRSFRMDRAQNLHMTFVAGPHRCLGINLARFELRIAFTEFLKRIPTFRLKPGAESLAMPGLAGAQHVPVVWDVNQ
ncbi:MAG TPA: cytochrome P450 [Sphingobium sp.]|uniref:cytochrome P450 n=1 Tax=Sphingobium sp. TaxID=1912891 RepID=UPI002ED22A67